MTSDQIIIRNVDPRAEASLHCLKRYYDELAMSFEHGFDVARSRDPQAEQMMPPQGTFLIAMMEDLPIGCVGLKGSGAGHGEVKRLWVSPSARGLGLGHRVMQEVEDAARALKMKTLRLDTNRALSEALQFYRRSGWTEIERFNDDPYADFFFEKKLG